MKYFNLYVSFPLKTSEILTDIANDEFVFIYVPLRQKSKCLDYGHFHQFFQSKPFYPFLH